MRKVKMLLVNNDDLFASNLMKVLTGRGYEALRACGPESALRVLDETLLDMVLLDLRTPGITIELLKEIMAKQPELQIIILTLGFLFGRQTEVIYELRARIERSFRNRISPNAEPTGTNLKAVHMVDKLPGDGFSAGFQT